MIDGSATSPAKPARRGSEIELKYAVPDAARLTAWLEGPALAAAGLKLGESRPVELLDRYVDTDGAALRAGGYAARLRAHADGVTISLKARATRGDTRKGRHERAEIEAPATDSPDPASWPESEARALVQRLTSGQPLRERFRIRQHRREWPISGAGGDAVVSLQAIEVYRAGRLLGEQDALEVELEQGGESVLRAVAAVLGPTGLVEPELTSKEELAETLVRAFHVDGEASPWDDDEADPAIDDASAVAGTSGDSDGADASPGASSGAASPGMAAADGSAAAPQAKPARGAPDPLPKWPGVRVDDTLGEAGRKVLAFHLARMLAREAGTREGVVEELHKMRVATRRMRATWRTFEGAYRPKRAGRYVRELKAVADRLGAVRDLDVQLEGLQAYAAANPGDAAGLEPLERAYRARRDAARDELLALLDSDAYRRFVEDYQAFVATPGDAERLSAPGMPSRVRDTAGGRIWTSYEHLRAYHDVLAWADVPTIHEVRIAGKRLRYALESFREVLGADADGLIARVTALQDHLGELNDADLAAHLTRDFLVREGARLPAPVAAALGRYLASREREVHARRRGLPAVWRQVVGPPFRRTLGRAISSL